MRNLAVVLTTLFLSLPAAVASAEEAVPSPDIVQVPEGWVFIRLVPGGFIMEHDDGSRVRVEQVQCGGRYGVIMAVDFPEDEDRERLTVRERARGSTHMTILVRIWPNGRREVRHLTVPWPEHIRQAFLRLLDPATRTVIHTE